MKNRKTFSRQQEQEIIDRLISDWESSVKVSNSMKLTPCTLKNFVGDESTLCDVLNSIDPNETKTLTKKSKTRILGSVERQWEVQNLTW